MSRVGSDKEDPYLHGNDDFGVSFKGLQSQGGGSDVVVNFR